MKKISLLLALCLIVIAATNSFAQLGNKNMYLLSNLNDHQAPYSAVWGYKAPDGREYAILGANDGTSFVDITDENNIHEVGFIPSTNPGNFNNLWREMKTYSHYAYIVSEVANSGVQIVDLNYLPDSVHYVKKFIPAGHTSSHSISQSGSYLYLNGCNGGFGQGVVILDLTTDPETPIKRGGFNAEYIHDCRVADDTIYAANIYSGKVSIINATNKNSLSLVTSFSNLPGSGPHNTALSKDKKHILVTDEIGTAPFRLKIWDINNLGNITYVNAWQPTGITTSIVHNVEVYGDYAVIGHYSAGLRVVDISNPAAPSEVAWYDTYPSDDAQSYEGCWGAYMFPSGKIISSDRSTGLYVVKMNFNITASLEGYYNSISNKQERKDTLRAYLRQTSSPYNVTDSSKAILDSVSLTANFKFNKAPTGTYYIVLKHRSSIETWSKAGGETYNAMAFGNYDFTSSDTQAYGNNMISVDASPVRFALYGGDSNQDGIVDAKDLSLINNDALNFGTGYRSTDIDGNNTVDVSDLLIAYNNAVGFVSVVMP
ncbi:MAG: choice-of-anchor B family protein [bacterium]